MSEKFAQWGQLLKFYIKRDWKRILLWVVLLGLFAGGFVPAFEEVAEDQGLAPMYEILQNPGTVAIIGTTPIETAADYTIGAMFSQNLLLFTALFTAIICSLHVISHTRKEEDQGITEYLSSFKIGRQANSLAVIIESIFINLLLMLIIAGIMLSFNSDSITVEGTFLYAASLAMAGIMGAVVALVMAQIFPNSSGATGSSLAIIGLLYVTRAVTDIVNVDLTLFNPLGWIYLTYPFTENNWIFLFFGAVFSIILLIIAFVLEDKRDMDTNYLPEKQGREKANKSLLSIPGLFMRLNKGIIISWLVALILLGIGYGSIYGDLQMFIESNEFIAQMFGAEGFSIEETLTGTILMTLVSLAAILSIVVVNKLFTEEKKSHLNQIFSTRITRAKLYWTNIILAVIVGIIGIGLASGFLGTAALAVMEEGSSPMELSDFFAMGYNQLAVLLFITGLAALFLGWAPKLNFLPYVYVAYSYVINGFLDFPEWVENTTVHSWVPKMPMEEFDGTVFPTVTFISLIMMVIGYMGYNRRDLYN